jgi:alanyl-tRNA synthetase
LREVQDRINAAIWANLPVRKEIMSYDEAMSEGAMALFGEKYGDRVRVVSMGDWSRELCGGTHVDATGDIGLLIITSETGIAAGVRRIEALAGAAAYAYVNDLRETLNAVAERLETRPDALLARSEQLAREVRERERQIAALTERLASREAESLVARGLAVNGFTVVAGQISADSGEYLQATADAVKSRLSRGIVVLGSVIAGNPRYTMSVTRNLRDEGFNAGAILREAASQAQGRAGGSAEFANGGGGDASRMPEVLQTAVELIRRKAEG